MTPRLGMELIKNTIKVSYFQMLKIKVKGNLKY